MRENAESVVHALFWTQTASQVALHTVTLSKTSNIYVYTKKKTRAHARRSTGTTTPPTRPNASEPLTIGWTNTVASAPVTEHAVFSAKLVSAHQCVVGLWLEVPAISNLAEYIEFQAQAVLVAGVTRDKYAPQPLHLATLASNIQESPEDRFLDLEKAQVGQIKKLKDAPVDCPLNDADCNGDFVEYKIGEGRSAKTYALGPPQSELGNYTHYEVITSNGCGLPFFVAFHFKFNHQQQPHWICLQLAKRGGECLYDASHSSHQKCLKITMGDYGPVSGDERPFKLWGDAAHMRLTAPDDMLHKLFHQYYWPQPNVVREHMEISATSGEESEGEQFDKFEMRNIKGSLSEVKRGDDRKYSIRHCNFTVDEVSAVMMYEDSQTLSNVVKIWCTTSIPKGLPNGLAYVKHATDPKRLPDYIREEYQFLRAEVVIDFNKLLNTTDVHSIFFNAHPNFWASTLTPDMLRCHVMGLEQPEHSYLITRFGRQSSGWWVLSNGAFKDGELVPLQDAGYHFINETFTQNALCRIQETHFPFFYLDKVNLYNLATYTYNHLMPRFFLNNLLPARAVLAFAVMGLHADRMWPPEPEAGTGGMSTCWVWSAEHNTGKSKALSIAKALYGLNNRPFHAPDATKSLIYEYQMLESGLLQIIDDFVPDQHKTEEMAVTIRSFFERSVRNVTGKTGRLPMCPLMISSNSQILMGDSAFQSRLITIEFDKLDDSLCASSVGDIMEVLMQTLPRISALMPVFETFGRLENGSLDRHAIRDCMEYMNQVIGRSRDRVANEWGKLSYFFFLLNSSLKVETRYHDDTFQWLINSMRNTIGDCDKSASVIDQFLIGVLKVRDMPIPMNTPPNRKLDWHNIRIEPSHKRSNEGVDIRDHLENWWSFRVPEVCTVLKNQLNINLMERDVMRAMQSSDEAYVGTVGSNARDYFYDVNKNAWPIKKTIVIESETGHATTNDVPLPEDELVPTTLCRVRCVQVKASYMHELRQRIEGNTQNVDYKQILIGDYNFYEHVCSGDWFGYRSLHFTPFAMQAPTPPPTPLGSRQASVQSTASSKRKLSRRSSVDSKRQYIGGEENSEPQFASCMNVIFEDFETGDIERCGGACDIGQQLCYYCLKGL